MTVSQVMHVGRILIICSRYFLNYLSNERVHDQDYRRSYISTRILYDSQFFGNVFKVRSFVFPEKESGTVGGL